MKIEAIGKEKETVAESMLRTQFKMECLVYTQDSTYNKKLGKHKRVEENVLPVNAFGIPVKVIDRNVTSATLKEMMTHLKSYYQVS